MHKVFVSLPFHIYIFSCLYLCPVKNVHLLSVYIESPAFSCNKVLLSEHACMFLSRQQKGKANIISNQNHLYFDF